MSFWGLSFVLFLGFCGFWVNKYFVFHDIKFCNKLSNKRKGVKLTTRIYSQITFWRDKKGKHGRVGEVGERKDE